jgi:retinol dehydrogenase-12
VFFVRALNEHLASSTPLVVDAVSPGYCYSELRRNFTGIMAVVSWIQERLLAFTAEEGSRQLVFGALGYEDHPEKLRGAYVSASSITEVSDFVLSPMGARVQDRLWVCLILSVRRNLP